MSDLEAIRQAVVERDALKSYCKKLMTIKDKDSKVMSAQEKEIERLNKTQDPGRQKMIADVAAMARANSGIRDIEEHMSKIKNN